MSRTTQTIWMILWRRALASPSPLTRSRIAEVVPDVVGDPRSRSPSVRATRLITGLLGELDRLPEGRQYFRQEGNAIVPLPEFARVPKDPNSELKAYPYEL